MLQQVETAQPENAPIQRRLLLDSDDSKRLTPEYLEGTIGIQPPQVFKDLFYALDDHKDNVPVKSGTPGNFNPNTKTVTVPPYSLVYAADRITGGVELDSDKKNFRTAMAQFGHEMQHASDYIIGGKKEGLDKDEGTQDKYLAVMDTELRAWATEAIVYKKYGADINQEGKDLIDGWKNFKATDIGLSDEVLKGNAIWARIIQYSTKNKFDDKPWRECAQTGDVLAWAAAGKQRVADHVDVQAQPEGDVTIDTLEDLNTNYKDLKAGGNRVEKVRREDGYKVFRFRRRNFKINNDVVTDSNSFDLASGAWPVPLVVEEPVAEEEAAAEAADDGPILLETASDVNEKASALKQAGNKIVKVRREGSYKIYAFEGKEYKVSPTVVELTYFDQASGAWA